MLLVLCRAPLVLCDYSQGEACARKNAHVPFGVRFMQQHSAEPPRS